MGSRVGDEGGGGGGVEGVGGGAGEGWGGETVVGAGGWEGWRADGGCWELESLLYCTRRVRQDHRGRGEKDKAITRSINFKKGGEREGRQGGSRFGGGREGVCSTCPRGRSPPTRRRKYTVVLRKEQTSSAPRSAHEERTGKNRTSKLPSGDGPERLGRVLGLLEEHKDLAEVLDCLARLDIDLALVRLDRPRDLLARTQSASLARLEPRRKKRTLTSSTFPNLPHSSLMSSKISL